MDAPQTIIRILSLKALLQAIVKEGASSKRWPSRIVASPIQVRRWESDLCKQSQFADIDAKGPLTVLTIMGVPVVEGVADCQPELIWASPISEAS